MSIVWLLIRANPWRAIALGLLIVVTLEALYAGHLSDKVVRQRLEASIAHDANQASQRAIKDLQAELAASNARYAVYSANVEAVEAARAKEAAKQAAKLAKAQAALQAALEANREWADMPTPDEVRKALR